MPLEKEDLDRLKEIFVTRQECDLKVTKIEHDVSEQDKKLAVIDTKLTAILWVLGVVGTGVIGVFVKMLFGA